MKLTEATKEEFDIATRESRPDLFYDKLRDLKEALQ